MSASSATRNRQSLSLRAQAAVEVLTYVSFFLLIFVILTLSIIMQVGQDISQREFSLSRSIAAQVADYVHLAMLAGPGFNATFQIPTQINGKPYSLNLTTGGSIYVYLDPGKGTTQQFYFPSAMRSVTQGCPACTGNTMWGYAGAGGYYTQVGINASKGWMRIETLQDSNGKITLRVG